MTFCRQHEMTVEELVRFVSAYGTSEGVRKGWLKRPRAKPEVPHGPFEARDDPDAPWRASQEEYVRHIVGKRPDGTYEQNPQVWEKYLEDARAVKKVWEQQMLAAVSEGRITPEDAAKLGLYKDAGEWRGLPETLFHVTTAAGAIGREGLYSRVALNMGYGRGLGGGDPNSVSMTDSFATAKSIYDALLEGKQVLNGQLTIEKMLAIAGQGAGASRSWLPELVNYYGKTPEGGGLPMQLEALMRGKTISQGMGNPPNWSGDEKYHWEPATKYDKGWMGGDNKMKYSLWERDLSDDEKLDATFQFYKSWITFREAAGGPVNPVFFTSDVKHLKSVDLKDVKILNFAPQPKAKGRYLGIAENEYRIYSRKAVRLIGDATP